MSINVGEVLLNLWQKSGFNAIFVGFADGGWQNLVMLIIACVLLYLGIVKKFEPLLLVRPEFMRIHRSYIVNMLQIDELSPAGVHTFSGMNLPVSRLLYPQLQKDYMKLLFAEREEL